MKSSFRIGNTKRAKKHEISSILIMYCGPESDKMMLGIMPNDDAKPVTLVLDPEQIGHLERAIREYRECMANTSRPFLSTNQERS